MLTLERGGERLVICAFHPIELQFAHHFEDFSSLHSHALLSWSYLAQ